MFTGGDGIGHLVIVEEGKGHGAGFKREGIYQQKVQVLGRCLSINGGVVVVHTIYELLPRISPSFQRFNSACL